MKIKIGVLGASGYTGADLIRLAAVHPHVEIGPLAANTHAGRMLAEVFPHFAFLAPMRLVKAEDADWGACDAVFCGLPHGTAQDLIKELPASVKVIDMSADFRLRDTGVYAQWYGRAHAAPELVSEAVYGLTEHYRKVIPGARIVACPGCYPTAALLALLPLVAAGAIDPADIIIDAQAEHPVFGSGGGAFALRRGKPPPRARNRAGDSESRGSPSDREFHPAPHPHEPRRTGDVLCAARRGRHGG
jgi:N-acetyl-gamma-glutamyl-phosphate reductase